MIINDRVYGENEITEEVLIKLINSKPIQRLKGVCQAGASKYVIKQKNVSRYEHSLGVMILLKKLGANIEEQIAGLLHDVPHTAFSHVIDFVFKTSDHSHEFHEKFHEKIIMDSEIPTILKKFNFDLNRILDEHNFKLLERNAPDLCADRVDYALRDRVAAFGFNKKSIPKYLKHLIAHENEIMFDNAIVAKEFAEDFIEMDRTNWSNPREVGIYQVLADALKIALDQNLIGEKELFMEDDELMEKLKNSGIKEITDKTNILNPDFQIVLDEENYDFHSTNKARSVNPKIKLDNKIISVGEMFPETLKKIDKHMKKIKQGNYIRIISKP